MSEIRKAVALACAALLLAGCGGEQQRGNPAPVGNASVLPRDGAPKVNNPLDTRTVEADPCMAATKAEIESLGSPVKSAKASSRGDLGPVCRWTLDAGHGQINAGPITANEVGLSSLYGKKDQLETFRPVDSISDYPGVVYSETGSDCSLSVGLRDDSTYFISVQAGPDSPNRGQPCPAAVKVAEFAIKHIREAQ